MERSFAAYAPQDRYQALARRVELPDRTTGSALFADISGFTPLTEAGMGKSRLLAEVIR
jgi:hypothetical protein